MSFVLLTTHKRYFCLWKNQEKVSGKNRKKIVFNIHSLEKSENFLNFTEFSLKNDNNDTKVS